MIGTKLAHYEITRHLGNGGMGEVYQATDTKLGRSVAIKLLPIGSTHIEDRLKRLDHEARVLASLNHPSIASIYGLEESDGRKFLVMELVPGETLAERIKRGPIPVKEAIGIGLQVAEALEVAHEKGIIHRDLKPANIMITPDGKLKLLDFGLARVFEPLPVASGELPTLPLTMSMGNTILGTAAYMSPEQARGKAVDKRTDIWAFGCVLFEMLTGRQAFPGDTVSDIITAILSSSPALTALPDETPGKIRNLIRKCVEKDPRLRLHDIADARIEIVETIEAPAEAIHASPAPKRRVVAWAALGLLISVLSLLAGFGIRNSLDEPKLTWSGSLLIGGSTIGWGPRVSPDGRRVAFIVIVDSQTQVALMDAESGSWDVLTKRPESGQHIHASWSHDGSKIYFTRGATVGVNIYSIPSVGGEERLVLDNAYFPEPLPDGSLLVTRSIGERPPQMYHFWPEGNRFEPLPVFMGSGLDPLVPVRAFADGTQAVVYGKAMTETGFDAQPRMYIMDLLSKQMRQLDSRLGASAALWPVSVDRDHSVLSDDPIGDLHRVVSMDRRGGLMPRELFTMTGRFSGLDMAGDGTIYVDQQNNALEILKINPSDGTVQHLARAETYLLKSQTVELPDGRVIVPSIVSGRARLLVTKTNTPTIPLVDTSEETSGPITAVGDDLVAFLLGSGAAKSVALASLADRRIIRKLSVPDAASIVQLASSMDGAILYYVIDNTIWKVLLEGGEPQKIATANTLSVNWNGREIILQRLGPNASVRMFRMPLSGGAEEEIIVGKEVRLGDVPLAANAVSKDGKILVTTALNANTWYWQVSVFDPKTGLARHIPTDFAGDLLYARWSTDGQILAAGVKTEGSIWRFRPHTP